MAKENMGDRIIEKLHERRETVRGKLRQGYKGVKPFRMEPIDNNELLFYYNGLSPDDMNYLVTTHGEEKVGEFIFEMEQMKQKKRR